MWMVRRVEPFFLALAAIGVPLAMDTGTYLAFTLPKLLILAIVVLGMTLVVLARSAVDPPYQKPAKTIRARTVALLLFGTWLIWQFLAWRSSVSNSRSWNGAYEWRNGLATTLLLVALAGLVVLLCSSKSSFQYLQRALVIGSVPVLIYALLQAVGLDPIRWDINFRPVFSTFGNSPKLAGYLAMIAPLTLVQAYLRPERRDGFLVLFAVQLFTVLITGARGGLLAMLIGAGVFAGAYRAYRSSSDWRHIQFAIAGLMGLSLVVVVTLWLGGNSLEARLQRIETVVYPPRETILPRIQVWGSALDVSLLQPILGFGPATFDLAFYATNNGAENAALQNGYWDRAHNWWLEQAIEVGWPGAFLFAAALFATLSTAINVSNRNTSESTLLFVGAPAGIVAGLVDRQFNPGTLDTDIIFWMLIGLALATVSVEPIEIKRTDRSDWFKISVGIITALFAAYSVLSSWNALEADRIYFHGLSAAGASDFQSAAKSFEAAADMYPPQRVEYLRALAATHWSAARSQNDAGALAVTQTLAQGALALEPLDIRLQGLVERLTAANGET